MGINDERLAAALDSDDPKAAIVRVLVARVGAQRREARQRELRQLRTSVLHERATGAGIERRRRLPCAIARRTASTLSAVALAPGRAPGAAATSRVCTHVGAAAAR